ncbi:oxygen-independent coproporphyrinogen-3 oxidase [Haloferula luteola]|uniref:Heme chaperone HemW n=1 Tax=Haloferula luteola TaxID=595692 RepID=A0A840UX32_9BACT|nr:radical SAM family heme chaperone HemW [Haloferula luteola]MBB5350717.1 oxygen-independent coproporphyrinogen-3 oxidase [Haloferula luteola]
MLLYLHIPFCHRVCPYCSFHKHTPGATPIGSFIESLVKEARHRLPALPPPRTLYFGGGTPSMLSPSHLRRLFDGLDEVIDFDALDEVTFEANPATFDLAKAELFRELGVRRVSLGIQSFAPHVLKTLGREHDPTQAEEAVRLLRRAGMPSVNIDLMFSVPGLTLDDWASTLETAVALEPDHISAYNLTYEEDTSFFDSLHRGEMDRDEDRDAEQFQLAHDRITSAGFDHYETSNYARPGHRSSHNHGYWNGEDYLGLGPSAVSTLAGVRHGNIADTARYVEMVNSLGQAIVESEALTPDQLRLERLALLLRTTEGVPLHLIAPSDPSTLIEHGLAEIHEDRLVLTRAGSALVDPIATQLA